VKAYQVYNYINQRMVGKKEISNNTKMRIYRMVYPPTLLCGSESWTKLKKHESGITGTIFRFKQIHRNNKIRLYKTLIKPVLCFGSVTWTLTQTTEQMLQTFERKILRRIYGPIQEEGRWRPRWNNELYRLYNDLNIVENIRIRRLGWVGHIIRMEGGRIPKKVPNGNFHNMRPVGRPRIRWEDAVQKDTLQILGTRG
jgi:hypothetical protein